MCTVGFSAFARPEQIPDPSSVAIPGLTRAVFFVFFRHKQAADAAFAIAIFVGGQSADTCIQVNHSTITIQLVFAACDLNRSDKGCDTRFRIVNALIANHKVRGRADGHIPVAVNAAEFIFAIIASLKPCSQNIGTKGTILGNSYRITTRYCHALGFPVF